MTWRKRDIWDVRVAQSDFSMHSLYVMRQAAHWCHLTWEYFSRLPTQAQAGYIAEYQTAMRIAAIEAMVAQARQKRAQAQGQMKRRGRPRIRR